MHAIKSKARHTAWKQDGTNYNPFSRVRSRPDRPNDLAEEEDIGLEGLEQHEVNSPTEHENHSATCVTDSLEMSRKRNADANSEFSPPRHANTSPTSADIQSDEGFSQNPQPEKVGNDSTATGTTVVGTEASDPSQTKFRRRRFQPWKKEPIPEGDEQDTKSPKKNRRKRKGLPITVWSQIRCVVFSSWINLLLLCVPIGIAARFANLPGAAVFVINFVAIVPLAGMLSYSTEEIALRTGEVLGGLLNASFGNAVELIVSIQALAQGKILIVKTSLIGSMLSNLLLVMGMSFFFGGINRVEQYFNVTVAQTAASLLALSIGSLIVPTVFRDWTDTNDTSALEDKVEALSRGTSIILLVVYACYLIFQLKSHRDMYNEPSKKVEKRKSKSLKDGETLDSLIRGSAGVGAGSTGGQVNQQNITKLKQSDDSDDDDDEEEPQLTPVGALVSLAISTALVAICSEFMVSAIDKITGPGSPLGQTFVGLILLPIVGNAAEHATAVTVACKDKMDLAIGVAVGSSMQIALLVLPLIDVLGWIIGSEDCHQNQMSLSFDGFQLAVLFVAVLLVNYLIQDGKSHWLEGVLLMASYIIIAVAAWFYPAGQDCTTDSG